MNVLITGASLGIGRELAIQLANKGYNLFLTYYSNKELCETLKKIIETNYNVKCFIQKCDLSQEEDIKEVAKNFKLNLGKLDLLINNASISHDNLFVDKTKEEFMNVLEINIVGTFLMCKYMIPLMNLNATIINMASTDGIDTYSIYNLDYAISKSGIIQLTKSMALIFPDKKILAIAPNWVDTESTLEMNQDYLRSELLRIGQKKLISKQKVADTIIKCLSNKNIKSGEVIKIYD